MNKKSDENMDRVQQAINENPWLFSPIPCASPSEEPQVDEALSRSVRPVSEIARTVLQ